MKLTEAVARRIENLLKERGLTQYGLSKLGGVTRQTINIVVKGQHSQVALDTVYQIAASFGMSLADFFDDPIFDDVTD